MSSRTHDPKTDHRSLLILVFFVLVAIVSIAGANGAFKPVNVEPKLVYSIDGCDVYRFVDESETVHMVKCSNGKASTSVNGKHVVTETK